MKEHFENATPTRLVYRDGTWSLEYEVLVPLGGAILRPMTYNVQGPETILVCLNRMPGQRMLAQAARQILDQPRREGEAQLAFEAVGGAWSPTPPTPIAIRAKEKEPPHPSAAEPAADDARLRALERKVSKMRELELRLARLEAVEQRLARLEEAWRRAFPHQPPGEAMGFEVTHQMMQGPGPGRESLRSSPVDFKPEPQAPTAPAVYPSGGTEPARGGFAEMAPARRALSLPVDAPPADPPRSPERSWSPLTAPKVPSPEPATPPAQVSLAPTATRTSSDSKAPVDDRGSIRPKGKARSLALPAAKEVEQALKLLVGDKVTVVEASPKPAPKWGEPAPGFFVSKLIDDENNIVGALIADPVATVGLGGGLMMMPEAALAEQIRERKPSEDVVDALSEIFNNISALFNKIKRNAHVRTSPAEPLDRGVESWMPSPARRRDLEDSSGGRMILLAR